MGSNRHCVGAIRTVRALRLYGTAEFRKADRSTVMELSGLVTLPTPKGRGGYPAATKQGTPDDGQPRSSPARGMATGRSGGRRPTRARLDLPPHHEAGAGGDPWTVVMISMLSMPAAMLLGRFRSWRGDGRFGVRVAGNAVVVLGSACGAVVQAEFDLALAN